MNPFSKLTPRPTGALIVCLCACLFSAPAARAATNTIIFDLGNFGADAVAYKQVRIAPVSPASFPRVEGVTVVGRDYGFKQTDVNGRLTNAMVSGTYDVSFTNRFLATTFQITVPTTNANGALYASELTTSGTNLPGNLVAYSAVASDNRFPSIAGTNIYAEVVSNRIKWNVVGGTSSGGSATNAIANGRTNNVAVGSDFTTIEATNTGEHIDLRMAAVGSTLKFWGVLNATATNGMNTRLIAAETTNAAQTVLISSNTLVINNESNRAWIADTWESNRLAASLTNNHSASVTFGSAVGVSGLLNANSALTLGFLPSAIPATDGDGIVGSLSYSTGLSYDGSTRTLSLSSVLQNLHNTGSNNATYVVGPSSATDNALAVYNSTTGKIIKNSTAILSTSSNLTGIHNATFAGTNTATSFEASGSGAGSVTVRGSSSGETTITQSSNNKTNTITIGMSAPSDGEVLKYNSASGTWTNGADNNSSNMPTVTITNTLRILPITVSPGAGTNVIIDFAQGNNFILLMLTNTHVVFSNVSQGVFPAQLWVQQDSNGTRQILSARVVGGNYITNGNPFSLITTTAYALDRFDIGSYYATNVFAFMYSSYSDLLSASNSLAASIVAATNSASVTNWINSRQPATDLLTNIANITKTATTVSGAGSGSTNYAFTLSTNSINFFYFGSSNINLYTVAGSTLGSPIRWDAIVTNLSSSTWGIRFDSGTNRWRFRSDTGTNAPAVLTNGTAFHLQGVCDGTNTLVRWTTYQPGI